MESKLCAFACLTCGENIKGSFSDVFEQFGMHMCPVENVEHKKNSLVKFQAIVSDEIKKMVQITQG